MPLMRSRAHWTLIAPLFLLGACGTQNAEPEEQTSDAKTAPAGEQVEWGYEGAGSPERWGGLNSDYAACESGTSQSPINLAGATRTDLPDPQFSYNASPATIENKGHTLQVNYAPGSGVTVGDTRYELAQFHFHTPSEHRLEGQEFPAELHLVHQGPGGALAVVGVMIQQGEANQALSALWNDLPRNKGETKQPASVQINAEDLLPDERQHFLYPGSLTTPPCSEGVTWMVLDEPIEMSAEQIQSLRSIIGTSNRPVQPLGNRELRLDT